MLKRALEASTFSAVVAGLLFFVTLAPMVAWAYGSGIRSVEDWSLAAFPLAVAAVLLPLTAVLLPSLASDRRVAFPLTFTYPALYCAYIVLVRTLLAGYQPTVVNVGERPRLDQVWGRWELVAVAFVVQVVTLLLAAGAQSARAKGAA